ncbi:MAG: methyltransferase domain-containing protein [bacterium]
MNPQNSSASPAHLAGGKPADEGQFLLGRRLRLVAPLMPAMGGHLVDFGCGNGAQTALFVPLFDRVTGVDVEPAFLEAFRRRIDAEGWGDRVTAAALEGGRMPLPDGCADVVISFTVLEHVPDEAAALAEMRRVLRPGGCLIISVPNRWWIFETHGADLPLLPWNRVPLVSWWPKRLHDRWARARIYRRREIVALVESAGFTITDTRRLTAPMDMIPWPSVQRTARRAIFRGDCTPCPFLATEVLVAAER